MKKVRISLRDSTKKWSFPLYESLTSYAYLHDKIKEKDTSFRNIITLSKGEFLEIEWAGADYCEIDEFGIFLDERATRVQMIQHSDHVRIGKCVRKSGRKGYDYVSGYTGWVPGGSIPWNPRNSPNYLKVIELKGRFKPRIDFTELFNVKEEPGTNLLLEIAEDAGIC